MPSLSLTLNVEPLAQTDHRHYVCEKYSLSPVSTTLELCHESHQNGPEPLNLSSHEVVSIPLRSGMAKRVRSILTKIDKMVVDMKKTPWKQLIP
jgi:hypothetical protein